MTAQERLAASVAQRTRIDDGWLTLSDNGRAQMAAAILAADPTLAQAIEDGTELALLREALPVGWEMALFSYPDEHAVVVYAHGKRYLRCGGPTIAAAARACREALEARKGPEGVA